MKEILQSTRELMKQGLPESQAYKMALSDYMQKHGFVFKAIKKGNAGKRRVPVLRESNDNRIKDFLMHPEITMLQQLEELQIIHRLLEQILKTKTL